MASSSESDEEQSLGILSVFPFDLEKCPPGRSWVNRLTAEQLKILLHHWHISPAETVDANRQLVRKTLTKTAIVSEPSHDNPKSTVSIGDGDTGRTESSTTIHPHLLDLVNALTVSINSKPNTNGSPDRLPQPVSTALASVTNINGADIKKLIGLFSRLSEITILYPGYDLVILKALVPKSSGLFKNILMMAISEDRSIEQFKQTIIRNLLPEQILHQAIAEYVYKPQQSSESLPDFIARVRDAINLLMPTASEDQTLTICRRGLTSNILARLAAETPPPRSVNELLALAPIIDLTNAPDASIPTPLMSSYNSPLTYGHRFAPHFNQANRPYHHNAHRTNHFPSNYNWQPRYNRPYTQHTPQLTPRVNDSQRQHPAPFTHTAYPPNNRSHSQNPGNVINHPGRSPYHHNRQSPNSNRANRFPRNSFNSQPSYNNRPNLN